MQWTVERLNSTDPRAMNPRFRQGQMEMVEAEQLTIDGGALIFSTGGNVTTAIGPGAWASVQQTQES